MAFLLKDSPECVKSELELFHLPGTQTVIESGQWVEFHPLSNIFDGGPITFLCSGSGQEYLDLSQTRLSQKLNSYFEEYFSFVYRVPTCVLLLAIGPLVPA